MGVCVRACVTPDCLHDTSARTRIALSYSHSICKQLNKLLRPSICICNCIEKRAAFRIAIKILQEYLTPTLPQRLTIVRIITDHHYHINT